MEEVNFDSIKERFVSLCQQRGGIKELFDLKRHLHFSATLFVDRNTNWEVDFFGIRVFPVKRKGRIWLYFEYDFLISKNRPHEQVLCSMNQRFTKIGVVVKSALNSINQYKLRDESTWPNG